MTQVVSFQGYTPIPRFDDVPWTEARIEEAATSAGTWAEIDVIALDPVDANPASPTARNLTTELASDTPNLWYRIIFADGSGDTSAPTEAVQNASSASVQFATADDFGVRLGETLTDAERDRVNALLARASGLIQEEARQRIQFEIDDELTVRGVYDDRLRLPQRPVISISSVTVTPQGGTATTIDPESYYLDGDDLVRAAFPLQSQRFFGQWTRGWFGPLYALSVVYTHGHDPIPEAVKALCMEMVVRVWVNPGAVAQESVGNTSTLYQYASNTPDPGGLLLRRSEKAVLRRLFGRAGGTVPLR